MMWRRRVSSAVLAPCAVRVTPSLPLHPALSLGLGARPLRRLSFVLQWSVACSVELSFPSLVAFLAQVLPRSTRLHPSTTLTMWVPWARMRHLAPSTPVVSSSFEGQVKRCLHPLPPLHHRPTRQKSPIDVCSPVSPPGLPWAHQYLAPPSEQGGC